MKAKVIIHLAFIAAVLVMALVSRFWPEDPGVKWVSWSDNVTVEKRAFHIHHRGEHGEFGGIKFAPELYAEAGDRVCVRLDATKGIRPYSYSVTIWYGGTQTMWMDVPDGETRCFRVAFDSDVYKVHVFGQGFGGVRVEPHIWMDEGDG